MIDDPKVGYDDPKAFQIGQAVMKDDPKALQIGQAAMIR